MLTMFTTGLGMSPIQCLLQKCFPTFHITAHIEYSNMVNFVRHVGISEHDYL